jgi:predicted  nucleic acid-binding Zn-ribbon protein
VDYSQLFPQLFELQKLTSRKAELALRLTQKQALLRSWEAGAEFSRHLRDEHHAYWDSEAYLRHKEEYDQAVQDARSEYKDICKEIDKLTERIDSEILIAAR